MLEHALEYAAAGWPVFPLQPRGKQPLGALAPHGVKDATTDLGQVVAWWSAEPEANIGVATGFGRWVLDLDDSTARERLEAAGVVLPDDTPCAATGHGAHFWFAGDVSNRTKVIEKVDVRGTGGYVVAPPSIHPEGPTYMWVVPPFGRPLPAPPSALLDLLGFRPASGTTVPTSGARDWVAQLLAGVAEGGRDDACTRLAGYFLGKGVPVEVTETLLMAWADRCTPPFPADQVSKCVASIAAREGTAAPDTLPPTAAELVDQALELIYRPVRNVRSTGLRELDEALDGGLEPGTLTLIGARPGVGKTVLMLQMAREQAASGVGVLFVPLESTPVHLMRRLLSQVSQVRFKNIKTGDLEAGERAALALAAEMVRALPLHIESRVRTIEALDTLLDSYAPGQIGAVYIDYAQKTRAPGIDLANIRAHVEHTAQAMAQLAVRRNLVVVAAASLSRPDFRNANWTPELHHLRESAVLEHEADNAILLHRKEGDPALTAFLRKQRDGGTAEVVLGFHGETLTVRGN